MDSHRKFGRFVRMQSFTFCTIYILISLKYIAEEQDCGTEAPGKNEQNGP
jgi:hypothetical protein